MKVRIEKVVLPVFDFGKTGKEIKADKRTVKKWESAITAFLKVQEEMREAYDQF